MKTRNGTSANVLRRAVGLGRAVSGSKRARRRATVSLETLETRQLLSVVSGNGGQGGTTKTLALEPGLNELVFSWENYSIPDEFQIVHQGQRIAGDIGLQSGGHSGRKVVAANGPGDTVTVKVTAPLEGTAWDFTVEARPFELSVDGLLGDVIKIDVPKLLAAAGVSMADVGLNPNGFSLQSNSNGHGKVAEINDWQKLLQTGVFYFAPTVTGVAQDYGATGRADAGLGDSELVVKNGNIELPIKLSVTDGFSTAGENIVTFGAAKLDVYRQQQRLAFLGFPNAAGSPLTVDGSLGAGTKWARSLFSIALDPAVSGRGLLPNPTNGITYFKNHINSANAPYWNSLTTVAGVTFSGTPRTYGTNATGAFLTQALSDPNVTLTTSTGVSRQNGAGSPSKTHEGGRSVDIDDVPGRFYNVRVAGGVAYLASPGGGIIVDNGDGTYRVGNPANPADRAAGVREARLNPGQQNAATKAQVVALLTAIRDLMDYRLTEQTVQDVIQAFENAGSPIIFYNDPRFFGGVVQFAWGHYDHIHFAAPAPNAGGGGNFAPKSAPFRAMRTAASRLAGPMASGRLAGAADLGWLDGSQTLTGTLTDAQPERFFKFGLGDPGVESAHGVYFDTYRDLSILLGGLSDDVGLELIVDPNFDGEGQVWADSDNPGAVAESLDEAALPSGTYYVRIFKKGGDTPFSLTIATPPLATPADNAGNSLADAADLGSLSGTVTRSDFIGLVDADDYYAFQLDAISDLDLTLDGLDQGDVTVVLGQDLDGDGALDPGEWLFVSDAEGTDPESIHLDRLAPGAYYVWVSRVSGNTNYGLSLTATPATLPADQAGDTPATANDLGELSGSLTTSDFIGDVDPVDVHRFSLASPAGVSIRLSGLSTDADLSLARDANGDGVIDDSEIIAVSRNSGTDDETIDLSALAPGVYYLIVNQFDGDSTYDLSLAASAPSGADVVVSRVDPSTPPGLGERFSYTITVTNQGVDAATNVRITDALPNGLELVSVSPASGIGSASGYGDQWTGRIASLAPGASASFTVTVYSYITGTLRGATTVTADNDYDASNNAVEGGTTVNPVVSPPADLSLGQTVDNALPNVGDQVTITITLKNNGPGTATEVKVRDALPAGLEYVSSRADLGSYDPATGIWTVGNLPPDVSVTLRIVVKMTGATGVVNTAEVHAVAEADPNSTPNNNEPGENDQASVTIGVVPPTEPEPDPNTAPTLAAIPDQTVNEGTMIRFTAQATDAESPSQGLTYSLAPGAPAGATIDPRTGEFSWTPAAPGAYTITVIVEDDGSPSLRASRSVTLTALGVAPSVSLGAGPVVYSYVEFASMGSFADPGVGPYSAVVDYGDGLGAQPLALNSDGTFSLAHAYAKSGQYLVTVIVTDATGLVGSESMVVTVSGPAPSGYGPVRDAFVTSLYVTLLDRDPEPRGLRFWSSALASNARTQRVATAIWSSREHAGLVARGVVPNIGPRRAHNVAMLAARAAIPRPFPRGPLVATPRGSAAGMALSARRPLPQMTRTLASRAVPVAPRGGSASPLALNVPNNRVVYVNRP